MMFPQNHLSGRVVQTNGGYCWYVASPCGLVRCALPLPRLEDAQESLRREFPGVTGDDSLLPELEAGLVSMFAGEQVEFSVSLDESRLTDFQRRVYRALMRVGWGEIITYGQLARRAGRPHAARAVGAAMARNPFPPVVPCHRVVASDGKLTGFSAPGGVVLKAKLIAMEAGS